MQSKLQAIIEALDMLGGIAIIDVAGGGYKPVYKNCGTCRFKDSDLTGLCVSPSSKACEYWGSKV